MKKLIMLAMITTLFISCSSTPDPRANPSFCVKGFDAMFEHDINKKNPKLFQNYGNLVVHLSNTDYCNDKEVFCKKAMNLMFNGRGYENQLLLNDITAICMVAEDD